jgi:hypothetical protein
MQQNNQEREIDAQEIRQIWQQLAVGTIIALVGIVLISIVDFIGRFLETL